MTNENIECEEYQNWNTYNRAIWAREKYKRDVRRSELSHQICRRYI